MVFVMKIDSVILGERLQVSRHSVHKSRATKTPPIYERVHLLPWRFDLQYSFGGKLEHVVIQSERLTRVGPISK